MSCIRSGRWIRWLWLKKRKKKKAAYLYFFFQLMQLLLWKLIVRRKKVYDTKSTSSGHEEVTFSFGVNYFVWCTLEWVNNQQLDCDSVLLARELGFLTPAGSKEVYDPLYPRQNSHLSPPQMGQGSSLDAPFPWHICKRVVSFPSGTESIHLYCDWIQKNMNNSSLPISFLWLLDSGKHCHHLPMHPLTILLLPHKTKPQKGWRVVSLLPALSLCKL